jgi:hypothetical protein
MEQETVPFQVPAQLLDPLIALVFVSLLLHSETRSTLINPAAIMEPMVNLLVMTHLLLASLLWLLTGNFLFRERVGA